MNEEMMAGNEAANSANSLVERLRAAAAQLEQGLERMEQRYSDMSGDVQRIVATVDGAEASLERRVSELEHQLGELRAQAARGHAAGNTPASQGRKTLPTSTAALLAKQGISASESVDAGALDAALRGLSIEQRIAVKSQLLRAGLLG